jgi:hypothetical protein
MSHIFKVGDRVSFGGLEGEVVSDDSCSDYPISVEFESGHTNDFTADGRLSEYHTEPLLKLVTPAKTKVKRALYAYQFIEHEAPQLSSGFYKDDSDFLTTFNTKNLKWFKRLPQTEIEVEE